MNTLKVKYVMIHKLAMTMFMQDGDLHVRVSNGIPKDAAYLRGGHDEMGNVYLVYCSEEWPELKEGDRIQEHCPYYEKLYPTDGQYTKYTQELEVK